MKIPPSALRVMNAVWDKEDITAKEVADTLSAQYGWNKNTSYTVIQQCIKKNLLERVDPGFHCRALVSRDEVQKAELHELLEQVFDGSSTLLFSTLVESGSLSDQDIRELEELIARLK